MKKTLAISSLTILLGLGSVVGYEYLQSPKNEDVMALKIPGYDSVDNLSKESNTIVKATLLSDDFTEIEGLMNYEGENIYEVSRVYKIQIEKPFKDEDGRHFKEGDIVELYVPIGQKQKKDGNDDLHPYEHEVTLEEGEYLFFLTNFYADRYSKEVLMLSNYHHIYKKNKNKFENIASTEDLPVIQESDIVVQ